MSTMPPMPTLISQSRWWKNWHYLFPRVVVLFLIAMLLALLGYLFTTHTVLANRRIGVPQTAGPANLSTPVQNPAMSQQAQQILEQAQKSLEEVKRQAGTSGAQIDEVRKELDEARKQTDRTDKITATFISIYTLLVALLAIDGLLSRTRLKEALQKVDDALAQQVPKLQEQMDKIGETTLQAQETLDRIQSTRKSLFEELPKFIRKYLPDVLRLNDPIDDLKPADLALLDEIDHLTFLANAGFRFRKPETPEEKNAYVQSVMATVRSYLVQRKDAEVIPRVNFVLELLGSDENTEEVKEIRGRAHSYAAQAHYRLLIKRSKRLDLQSTNDLLAELEHHRNVITFHLGNARKLYPRWAQSYVIDALYRSNCAASERVTNENERRQLHDQGQHEAINIYQVLISDFDKYEPNVVGSARRNLCCCLKRLGDESGQYDDMFRELESYPTENEILSLQSSSPLHKEATSSKLWQGIMSDSTFFNSLHVTWTAEEQRKRYEKRWADLLKSKLNFSSMEKCDKYFHTQSPSMNSWIVKPWQS